MLSKTQEQFMLQAKEATNNKDYDKAIAILEEANSFEEADQIVSLIIANLLLADQKFEAYLRLQDFSDLFANEANFITYLQVLQANHYLIEKLQVLTQLKKLPQAEAEKLQKLAQAYPVTAVATSEIPAVIKKFRQADNQIEPEILASILVLPLEDYLDLVEYLVQVKYTEPLIRNVLFEELVKLDVNVELQIEILGNQVTVNPHQYGVFKDSQILFDGLLLIEKVAPQNPIFNRQIKAQFIYILTQLYPIENDFIKDLDFFIKTLVAVIENGGEDLPEEMMTSAEYQLIMATIH